MLDRSFLVTCVQRGDRYTWAVRGTWDGEVFAHHGSAERMQDARRDAADMVRLMVVSDMEVVIKENATPEGTALSILPGDA